MTETIEIEDVKEVNPRQFANFVLDELKALREEISDIKHTIVQMSSSK